MNDFVKILVADHNEMSREMIVTPLRNRGYAVFPAEDGQKALQIVKDEDIHLAIIDARLKLVDGLEFVKTLLVDKRKIPSILVTEETSSDLLMRSVSLGVQKVLQKPVPQARLMMAVERIIDKLGFTSDAVFVEKHEVKNSPEDLMRKAIDLAETNAKSGQGRAFGAIVADKDGHVLGKGTNGITSRADPSAHAEVVAIRQAAAALGRADLSDCVLYCTGEPTKIGKALIESVAIGEVCYALSHEEVAAIRDDDQKEPPKLKVKQLGHDEAAERLSQYIKG
ncbi:MAG: response regulator [Pseudomonadota bacterium]